MYPMIVCRCGRSLGDLFDAFKKIRRDLVLERANKLNISPAKLMVSADINIEIGDILDMFHLSSDCCRQVMLTQVEFTELYNNTADSN
jgi:DNA-directed RNA polymerase subunit N (RpoN/RPB10)